MMGFFLPLLPTCLAINCYTWGDVLKCLTSLRFPSSGHFIGHDVPSSFNASFESINGSMDFSQMLGIIFLCILLKLMWFLKLLLDQNLIVIHSRSNNNFKEKWYKSIPNPSLTLGLTNQMVDLKFSYKKMCKKQLGDWCLSMSQF
jgi:hypothetical protein